MPDPQLRWRTMNSTPTQTQAARPPTEEAALFDLPFWGPLAPVVIAVVDALYLLGVPI
ncbi:hypothetical protein GS440_24545 [Rhodococcus hoagii]|nr:hypothetical protein [Prescottella equi]